MNGLSVGSIVRCRNREWIMLPSPDENLILLRPLTGSCIISHSAQHTGAASMALTQTPVTRLTRSQFLNEMGIPSVNRTMGLTSSEAAAIVAEVNNL
jgi:hypothetical protein